MLVLPLTLAGLATGPVSAAIIWYWFSVNGQPANSHLDIKLREARNLLAGIPSIATAVIVSSDVQSDVAASRSAIRKFVGASYGPINRCIALTRQHPACTLGNNAVSEN